MVTMNILLLSVVCAVSAAVAGEHPARALSRYEIQQHLLGGQQSGALLPTSAPDESAPQRKSKGLAAIYSLILPGMGELYAGDISSGKYFMIAEGAMWLTYAIFEIQGNQLRDDSRAFAQAHAGINPSGKNDQYFVDIGNFINIDEYNDKKLRDRQPEKLYNPSAGYAWQWDSDASRSTFRAQRVSSENMYNNRKFVVAAILINHVGSAINAVRAVIAHNDAVESSLGGIDIHADVMGEFSQPHGILVTITKTF